MSAQKSLQTDYLLSNGLCFPHDHLITLDHEIYDEDYSILFNYIFVYRVSVA